MNNYPFRVNELIADQMILQANQPVILSGSGIPGDTVVARIGADHFQSVVLDNGQWQINAGQYPSKTSCTVHISASNGEKVAEDVLFGNVYVFAGQSNIEYLLKDEVYYSKERELFGGELIRYFNVPRIEYEDKDTVVPENLPTAQWTTLNKETMADISAIAYYAVKELRCIDKEIPLGIISCYKGGTSASCWISQDNLVADPRLKKVYYDGYLSAVSGKSEKQFVEEKAKYEETVRVYTKKKTDFIAEHPSMSLSDVKNIVGHTPWPPPMNPKSFLRPNGLYKTMFQKIVPFSVKGVVWYQGENDADHPKLYRYLLPRLIKEWRRDLLNEDLPFYIIQLPKYADEPENAWAYIREAQQMVSQQLSNVHLVSIVDTGDEHNIHPTDKSIAGERLGEILANRFYPDTPKVEKVTYHEGEVTLSVSNTKRIVNKGNDRSIRLTFSNNHVEWISPKIMNNLFKIKTMERPVQIDYAFENAPNAIFYNECDYPLSPFLLRLIDSES